MSKLVSVTEKRLRQLHGNSIPGKISFIEGKFNACLQVHNLKIELLIKSRFLMSAGHQNASIQQRLIQLAL